MELKMMEQFENIKDFAENTEFFTDPISIEIGQGLVLIDKLKDELNKNPTILNPYLTIANNSIFLKGSIPWTNQKIDEYYKALRTEPQHLVKADKTKEFELDDLKNLLLKYPKEALKMLSEQ